MRYALLALAIAACSRSVPQADGDRACQSVGNCKESGACWYNPQRQGEGEIAATGVLNGQCEPRSDADCERSAGCALLGRCTASAGECRLVSAADCAKTDRCNRRGHCDLLGAPGAEHCGKLCTTYGFTHDCL